MIRSPFSTKSSRRIFFPNDDIFSAQLKSRSYAWRSILSARKVIIAGAKWRIGNGLNTQIYQDCWLPGDGSGRVLSPVSVLPTDAMVANLIDGNLGWWNVLLIDFCFLPFEAQKIKSIPKCFTPPEDILIWPKSKYGKCSIKSGYHCTNSFVKWIKCNLLSK